MIISRLCSKNIKKRQKNTIKSSTMKAKNKNKKRRKERMEIKQKKRK